MVKLQAGMQNPCERDKVVLPPRVTLGSPACGTASSVAVFALVFIQLPKLLNWFSGFRSQMLSLKSTGVSSALVFF